MKTIGEANDMKYCIKCGNELKDQAQFCAKCGTNQGEASPIPANNIYQTQAPNYQARAVSSGQTSKTLSFVIVACGIVGFVVLLFVGMDLTTLRSVGGTSVAESYYQSIGAALIGLAFVDAMFTAYFAKKLFNK